tara:strand:+ start:1146 stop:1886 length:741 start_codon:yes stop_codon:yes gene_type:complete
METEQIPWEEWIGLLVTSAIELKEAGMELKEDPSEDIQALRNIIAISAAEWRKGNDVNPDGPGMGKALGDEESYSPVQIFMPVWGKDTSDKDVTLINSPFVPEFKGINKEELIDFISTNKNLAAKAAVIMMQNNRGYDIWSTWQVVTNPENKDYSQNYFDFANDYDIPEKPFVPSDAVDPDRIFTPSREPGTGRPLDKDGKVIPFTPDPPTAREKTLRDRQAKYFARIKLNNILDKFDGSKVDVDK